MATTKRRWLPIVAGVLVLLVFAAVGVGLVSYLWFRDKVQVAEGTSADTAKTAFDNARKAFPDARPILTIDGHRRAALSGGLDTRHNPGSVSTVHVLAWDAGEHTLATVTLPMWLLRMKSGPIAFGEYASGMDEGVRLDAADVERYGPGIVLEYESPSGDHVLVTAQ